MEKRFIKILIKLKDELLDIIYPPIEECCICGEVGFIAICRLCEVKIKRDREEDSILSYGQYGGVLKRLILLFKYKKNFSVGKYLSKLMYNKLMEIEYIPDIILYIPSSKEAKKRRGFNHCEFLAKELAKEINCSCRGYIQLTRETKEQKRLSIQDRITNIKGAFEIKYKKELYNKKILVIDDVVTTGATLQECYRILQKIEYNKIKLLTLARSKL